ncbi:MAG: toprim domain-containing protein, partial [Bacilli bacterium]|nr:toprim domain-containing protein [Bacilli bacterium]
RSAGRLIFPLSDEEGRVVGFSARKFNELDDGPKYVNSPESSVFHKSTLLYNLHNAKLTAKNDNYVYIVEGFLDVIALYKINFKSVVAIMGTALTKEHATLLRPLNVEVRLCLDSDNAGQMAMMRAMPLLDKEKINYRLVLTPNNKLDPDEILKDKGEDELKLHLNTLVDPFDFALNYYETIQPLGSTSDRHKVIKHFLPMLLKLNKGLELDNRLFKLAKVTRFEPKALAKFIEEARTKDVDEQTLILNLPEMQFKTYRQDLRRLQNAEKTMLYYMFQDKDSVSFYEEEVKFFYFEIYRHIALYIIDFLNNHETLNVSQLINDISLKDVANKEEVINEISSFAVKFTVPPVNDDILSDLKKTMNEEKTKLHEKEKLEKSLIGKSETEKARIIDDYNRKLRKGKK